MVAGRGCVAAPGRRGAAHVPRAGAGHQAVPGGAERSGRAPARQHRHRVSDRGIHLITLGHVHFLKKIMVFKKINIKSVSF